MAQIQIRDDAGAPIPRANIRISEGTKPSDEAIFDVFTDLAGNTGWPIPHFPVIDYTLHINDQNVLPEFGHVEHFVPGVSIHTAQDIRIVLPRTSAPPVEPPAPPIDPPIPGDGPRGTVRTSGRMMLDDRGPRNFLSTTLMWANWGYREDRDRLKQNFAYLQSLGLDGIRPLGSVMGDSWAGRQTDPTWPDYEDVIAGQIDLAWTYGLRQFPFTMLGDHFTDVHKATDRMISALRGREEKIGYLEIANEWGHAVEISEADLMTIAKKVRAAFPNMLLALSRPKAGGADVMKALMKQIGGPLVFPRHTERKENDRNWRQVRQSYDFQDDDWTASQQEPPGPASSVGELWKPRQHGCMRWLAHAAGCGIHCHHTGAGVRGRHSAATSSVSERHANLFEVPGFVEQIAALKMIERFLPEGVQNWNVENNGRDKLHPLQLPEAVGDGGGFWAGDDDVELGDVNKNYAVLGPDGRFMVGIFGLNGETNEPPLSERRAGQALYPMVIEAFDSLTGESIEKGDVDTGEWITLPGRRDREMSYIVMGQRR